MGEVLGTSTATIFTSMMLEPTPRGRLAAIGVLADLLDGSKQFLAQATEEAAAGVGGSPAPHKAFKSFSSTLGAMIREAHGARFPTKLYTRGCHWIPHMFV
jgi:hypothetical protein